MRILKTINMKIPSTMPGHFHALSIISHNSSQ